MKRLIDFFAALLALIVLLPILLLVVFLVWVQDFRNPLYTPYRVGINGRRFRMFKIRSMVPNADKTRVDSTAEDDVRITPVGRFIRKIKFDEVPQLINVLLGDMSLVGPRPNVDRETVLYTEEEKKLLTVRPGITDFASIIFADLGQILKGSADANLEYNQKVRPWKSRLGLFYVENRSLSLDAKLILLTILNWIDRPRALKKCACLLARLGADPHLQRIAVRAEPLRAAPPPGAEQIVQFRPT